MTDTIRTARLILRRWRDVDIVSFADINADDEVMRFFPSTLSLDETAAMVERIESHFDEHGFGLWAVEIDGRLAGFTGLNTTTFDTPMGPHVEIGWRLATWAWGMG
ncbi:MAG: GNAT family N-acetyltransferase, partial [Ilumatobacteraceae bacterium]